MTSNKLATLIAKLEGKRSQARIGDIREIIKIIQTLIKDEVLAYNETKTAPIEELLFSKAQKAVLKGKKNVK